MPDGADNPTNDPAVDALLERARRLRQESAELVRTMERLRSEITERRAVEFDRLLQQLEGRDCGFLQVRRPARSDESGGRRDCAGDAATT